MAANYDSVWAERAAKGILLGFSNGMTIDLYITHRTADDSDAEQWV